MDWQGAYHALSDHDREEFARVISRLFDETFLVRDEWDPRERRLAANRDYRFVERHLALFQAYLRAGGFELQADGRRGVMALYNRYGRNRAKMDKYTTYLLYALRLVYEEAMETVSMRREVVVTLQDVLSRLFSLGLLDRRVAATNLAAALNRLRRLNVIARVDGFAHELESRWLIYPSILLAVPDERIHHLYERWSAGAFAAGAAGERADGGEWAGEDSGEDGMDAWAEADADEAADDDEAPMRADARGDMNAEGVGR